MTDSKAKCAIVTGVSGGIGGSVAQQLAKDRFSVVVNDAGKPVPAQAMVADLAPCRKVHIATGRTENQLSRNLIQESDPI